MYTITGAPLEGAWLERLQQFLRTLGLRYDINIRFTVLLIEDDQIAATGSLDGSTLKCIAVDPRFQGEDLTAQVITALFHEAAKQGIPHLMLYTKPQNQYLFAPFGFHSVIRTTDCLLMENKRSGLSDFLTSIEKPKHASGSVGCIVAHCNPFTLGHRYLIMQAAAECSHVYVFILSEDKGMFAPEERLRMAREGCEDINNVSVHPGGPYMVSSATFPSYFIKDEQKADQVYCEADLRLFGEKIAPALSITRRYVGSEPRSPVTCRYNEEMHALLPRYGIEVREFERITDGTDVISASRVRRLLKENDTKSIASLLPESSIRIIMKR